MAPFGVLSASSIDMLKRQLEAAFGTVGNGSLNIAELQKLLHMLIELHEWHQSSSNDSKRTSEVSISNFTGEAFSQQASKPRAKRMKKSNDVTSHSSNVPDCKAKEDGNCSPDPAECENEGLSNSKDSLSYSTQCSVTGESLSEHQWRIEEEIGLTDDKKQEPLSVEKGAVFSQRSKEAQRSSDEIFSQRSSDFNVKSTSSETGGHSTPMCDRENYRDSREEPYSTQDVIKNFPKSVVPLDGHIPSREHIVPEKLALSSGATGSSPTVDLPLTKFVTIVEACKSHLEAIKEEVCALKRRCESQHEDMVKLAGGLDNLMERWDEQSPMVNKLEKDTHCLGMLISDYEQNFASIEKRLQRNDERNREHEKMLHRMDKEHDARKGELRSVGEQLNYLSNAKADRLDVQSELNRRAFTTDLELRVPYEVFNDGLRELTRFVTQVREKQHELEENLKTVQYELVRGLDAKAPAQDVSQIRKQLVGVIARWQKAEKGLQCATGGDASTQLLRGSFHAAAVAMTGPDVDNTTPAASTCLSCGVQSTIVGSKSSVPMAVRFVPSWKRKTLARHAGGLHTKSVPAERVFRTGSLNVVQEISPKSHARM